MKKKPRKNRPNYQKQLVDEKLYKLLEKVDEDLAEQARQAGCVFCSGKVFRSDYTRQPRGGPANWDKRHSFCCGKEGCRRRRTPPSVRFLGRKVYVGVVVVLLGAMNHGCKPQRVRVLQESLGVDARTLKHWRQWWLETFVQSPFWKEVRSRFRSPICESELPLSLCECFAADPENWVVKLLKFLAPITTQSGGRAPVM